MSPANATVSAPAHWLQVGTTVSGPSPRYDGAMVYDATTGTTLFFGGFNGTELNETWSWNGIVWQKLSPTVSPPALRGASMVYDPATHNVVLFGGLSANGPVAGTWTWDGTNWTQQLVSGPAARSGASMVYDATTNNVVLFGGKGTNGLLSDTWFWNGTSWTSPTLTAPGPTPRYEQAMAYDPTTKSVVLYGGMGVSSPISDTWTWNGTQWTQEPAANPAARFGASMFYDANTGNVVLFGGSNGTASYSEMWNWNGTSWSALQSSTAPSARSLAALAYNTSTNSAILFGGYSGTAGLSDTWSFVETPGGPLNVRATSNANAQSVVTWSPPTGSGGTAIYGYTVTATDVTVASRGGQTCTTMGTTIVTVSSTTPVATTCTVTGLTNGDQYQFAVSAMSSVGTGPASTSNVVRPATVPSAPVITKVVPSGGAAVVYWNVPTDTGGTPVASYRVIASPGGAFCHVPRSMTSCRIGGLQGGVTYTFTMTATNAAGTSAVSAPVALGAPATGRQVTLPGSPFIIAKSVVGNRVTLRWRPPVSNGGVRLSGYNVLVGTSPARAAFRPVVRVPFNQFVYSFNGTGGQTYFVVVRAVNSAGVGPFSNQIGVRVGGAAPGTAGGITKPGSPFITSRTVAGTRIVLHWHPPASNGGIRLSGYNIYIGTSPNGAAFRPLVSVPFNQFAYAFNGVRGVVYYAVVTAVNSAGIGPFSNQVAVAAQ
ncbi:MAG: hypothetical protein HIU57_02145 [Acidobacteria bacterium]|nr:hypothetical protein [Acidobacteriota bacterium]